MSVRQPRQTLEALIAEQRELAAQHRARGRPTALAERCVHIGEQPHVRRRTAAHKGPCRPAVTTVADAPPSARCCAINRVSCARDSPVIFAKYAFTAPLSDLLSVV